MWLHYSCPADITTDNNNRKVQCINPPADWPASLPALISQKPCRRLVLLLSKGALDLSRLDPDLLSGLVEGVDGPAEQFLPVEAVEEEVLLELLVAAALAVLRTAAEQLLDEGLAALGAVARVLDAGVDDLLVDGEGVLRGLAEGQFAAEQLVGDHAQGPQVDVEAVALARDDLRGHVVRRADDGVRAEAALDLELLGRAHVHQREEAVHVHHQVLGLEVAVDDAVGVQVLHHQQHLSHQLPRVLGREGDHLGDHVEEVLALDELHDEVDEVAVLDELVEGDHKGKARHRPQDLLLVHDVLDNLRFLHVRAVQHLDCVDPLRLHVPARVHLPEVALTQLPHHVEVRDLHLLLQRRPVLLPALLRLHADRHWGRGHLHLVEQLPNDAVVRGHHVLLHAHALPLEELRELDDGVRLIGGGEAFELGIEQDVDAALVVAALPEDGLALLEGQELAGVGGGLELGGVERLVELALADDLPHDIALDNVLEAAAQASLHILAAHGDDHAARLGHERVGADAALDQDGVLAEAVHGRELMVLLLDEHGALLDDVEGVGVIALVEDHLPLLVGLGEAGGGERVLLLLRQLLEEGEYVQELLVLLLVLLVDLLHHLQEDAPVDLSQLAVRQRQHRGRARRVVDDPQVAEGVAVGKRAFLLAVDLNLADALEDDVVGAALVPLAEDVVVADGHAGLHLLDEAADLGLAQLREDEVLAQRLPDLALVGSPDRRLLAVLHVVLHLHRVVLHDQRVLASSLLQRLLLSVDPRTSLVRSPARPATTGPDSPAGSSCSSCANYSEDCLATLHWHAPIFYIRKLFRKLG